MSGTHAYWNVSNKLASSCGPGDAWNNIGVDGASLPQTKNQSGVFNPPQGTKVQP